MRIHDTTSAPLIRCPTMTDRDIITSRVPTIVLTATPVVELEFESGIIALDRDALIQCAHELLALAETLAQIMRDNGPATDI